MAFLRLLLRQPESFALHLSASWEYATERPFR